MKILFVTRGFPSTANPMMGNYESVQARAVAAKGHEVSVIAIHWKNLLHLFGSKKVKHRTVDGIKIYECDRIKLSIPHIYFPKLELWAQRRQFKKVYEKCVKEIGTPDVVHAHILMYAAPAICLKTEYHLPFVITEHWSRVFEQNALQRVLNQMSAYHLADKVICVSKALADNLQQKCGLESIVVSNMVDNDFFRSRKVQAEKGTFRFIAVGAMRQVKRFDLLVEAFALCHFPEDVELQIVGDGVERPLIESKIKEFKVSNQVKLMGMKTPAEVSGLLCQADCFVLSSRLETFSIVLIEAMAKGLPVIATKCGGPETFVRPEDGLLVEKENVEVLTKAMRYMRNHSQDFNVDEIRQHCYDNYSQEKIADKIIEIYKQVLK